MGENNIELLIKLHKNKKNELILQLNNVRNEENKIIYIKNELKKEYNKIEIIGLNKPYKLKNKICYKNKLLNEIRLLDEKLFSLKSKIEDINKSILEVEIKINTLKYFIEKELLLKKNEALKEEMKQCDDFNCISYNRKLLKITC